MSAHSQLPQFHVVGFSGHRHLAAPGPIAAAIRAQLEMLRAEAPGEWIALTSVAEGSDQLFIGDARQLGLAWHAILPLPRAEFAQDFSPEHWAAVERTLATAEHVRVITENGTRNDAYLDCGMEVANGADVLLVVWDGAPARGRGGTADVVAYAQSLGQPIVVIDPHSLEVRRENFPHLARADQTLLHLNRLPDAAGGWGDNPFKAPENIFAFQRKCDFAASHGAPQFRRLIVATVLLHVAATLVAAAGLAFNLHSAVLPWVKLLCLLGALGVAIVLRRHHHAQGNWVRCRLAAEFCRSALATWGLPRAAPLFADLDLPGVRGLTRALHFLHSRSAAERPVPMDEFKRIYLGKRIDDQHAYYSRQEARALPLLKRLKFGFGAATILAILCTFAYAVSDSLHLEVEAPWRFTVFYFLPITLPVIAAAFISFISINDLQRRVARFREMRLLLADSRKRIAVCTTWNSLERIVLKTERALLQEVLEWHSITSFAESH